MRKHKPSCQQPVKTIVCPPQHKCVNTCSYSQVNYVHPIHTTVMDQHTVQNKHFYPQTTSWEQNVNQTNVYGGQTWPPNSGNNNGFNGHNGFNGNNNCNSGCFKGKCRY
ncbi:CotD family spore coat protein [Amphibacillus sp. Q70]|uniref:CotD family spore coat protein n=1 Tax=Amphibacillus sp. Q70 TaxID=3453416 RepID=UPI003F85AFB2